MSLTVTNNLSQQTAVQTQVSKANGATAATPAAASTDNSQTAQAQPSVADALISGKANLTSDLLSVLLNEQSNQSILSSTSLAGMIDQQDQAIATGTQLQFDPTGGGSSASSTNLAGILDQQDQASASANATGSVLGSLPTLLTKLNQ